jgi:hypothetical protein
MAAHAPDIQTCLRQASFYQPSSHGRNRQRRRQSVTLKRDAKAHRGQGSVTVRGSGKVLASASLFVLTCDPLRLITLTA